MPIDYDLRFETKLSPNEVLEFIRTTFGLNWNSDQSGLFAPGLLIGAIPESVHPRTGKTTVEVEFDFRSDVVLYFTLLDYHNPGWNFHITFPTIIKMTSVVLTQEKGRAVLIFNTEALILQRLGDNLEINRNGHDWLPNELAELTLPYDLKDLVYPPPSTQTNPYSGLWDSKASKDVRFNTLKDLDARRDMSLASLFVDILFFDHDRYVRERAAVALGNLGGESAKWALTKALEDETWDVRRMAAAYLRDVGDSQAIAPLLEALRKEEYKFYDGEMVNDNKVSKSIAKTLVKLGGTSVVEPLIDILNETKRARKYAALALGMIGDKRAVDPLLNALKIRMVERWDLGEIVEALGELGDKNIIPALQQFSADTSFSSPEEESAKKYALKVVEKLNQLP